MEQNKWRQKKMNDTEWIAETFRVEEEMEVY